MTAQPTFATIAAAGAAYLRDYAAMYPRERGAYGFFPFGAAYIGLHGGDGRVTDYSAANVARRLQALEAWSSTLDDVAPRATSADERQDLATLRWARGAEAFALAELQPHLRHPLHYNDTIDVSGYIRRNYAPLDERLRGLLAHLRAIPDALAVAQTNLRGPLPRVALANARQAYRGHIAFLQKDLLSAIQHSDDRALIGQIETAAETAIHAIADLVDYLGAVEPTDDCALGTSAFWDCCAPSNSSICRWRSYAPLGRPISTPTTRAWSRSAGRSTRTPITRTVSDRLREDHPAADGLLVAAAGVLDSLREFIEERRLVSLPSSVPPTVAETPAFHRWSFASMDSPGAFEDEASGAHYYITSPEPDWTPAQQQQWLRRFFHAALVNTSAHEAFPGHYVQSQHKRLAPTATQRAFDSFTHWEAWAHYVEQMILDEGYANNDPSQRVAQLGAALLRDARYMVAIGLHCDGMTVDEATRVIMDATLMDELPARREAERGTFDPGYGSYTLGKLLLLKLRRDAEAEQGANFSLGAFHDAFLDHGAPPFPILRPRVLSHDDGRLL